MIMISKLSNQNYWRSSDLALCATLCCYGYCIETIDRRNPSKAIFSIKKDERLDDLIQKYWAHQIQIEPMSYFNFLKEIKARIYNA